MKVATVKGGREIVRDLTAFGGLNVTDDVRDGELSACENLSTRRFPCLASRSARALVAQYEGASAYDCFDGHEVVCANGRLFFDGSDLCAVEEGGKQFCVVGKHLCVFPDKLMIDVDSGAVTQMDASVSGLMTLSGATVCLPYYRETGRTSVFVGSNYYFYRCSLSQFASAWDGTAWDLSKIAEYRFCSYVNVGDHVFLIVDDDGNPISVPSDDPEPTERYNAHGRFIIGRGTAELQLTCPTLFSSVFAVGDAVSVDGERYMIASFDDETNTLSLSQADFAEATKQVTVQRDVPDLDFVCEHENRLWGASNATRTVYASALGEPTRFWTFDGVSTDSYQLVVGGEGDFTAICSYAGALCLFRERKLHKVLGGYPAEFYLTTRDVAGVRVGCHKSIRQLGGALYYLGVGGVQRFTGSAATCVSKKLGAIRGVACGGADGRRYYLSAGEDLYVYDLQTGLWLREDGLRVTDFAFADGLRMLAGDAVWRVGDGAADADTPFSATFAPFSERAFARKRYARLALEVELGAGAFLTVEVRCDGGAWRAVGTLAAGTAGVEVLRLPPMRCGSLELRLRGAGDCAVLALRRRFEARSERES